MVHTTSEDYIGYCDNQATRFQMQSPPLGRLSDECWDLAQTVWAQQALSLAKNCLSMFGTTDYDGLHDSLHMAYHFVYNRYTPVGEFL